MVAARRSIGRALSQAQASLYICRSCRNQLSRTALSIQQQRFTSNESSNIESIRRRSRGSDNSPGLKDSYGGSGFLERGRMRKVAEVDTEEVVEDSGIEQAAQNESSPQSQESQQTTSNKSDKVYTPAESWEGLQFVGSSGSWHDVPATPEDEFSSWLEPQWQTARTREELVDCLLQAFWDHESEMLPSVRAMGAEDTFLEMKLDMDNYATFEFLKRFSQLSGHRIPDPTLNSLFSSNLPLSFLLDQLVEKVVQPKPTKIADILLSDPVLSKQSNVSIFPRRETSIDKEKEVGRWKVIEKELQSRGLPVTGKLKQL